MYAARNIFFICITFGAVILKTNAAPPQKIVKGIKVVGNEFPFLVSLRQVRRGDGYLVQFCGGAIISNQHILTAAHCLTNRIYSTIRVVVGTNSLTSGGVSYSLQAVAVHPKYRGPPADIYQRYDIAILTLSQPLDRKLSSNWQIVKLPSRDYPAGTEAAVAGWGDLYYDSNMSPADLQHIHVKLSDFSQCGYEKLREFHLCTVPMNGKSTCQGDSGGPLVANGEVIGIVSYGFDCGKFPGAFAKVRAYKTFIEQQTGLRM